MDQVEHAKLLAALLGVLKKENSKIKDDLLKELHEELDNMTGTKYVQVDEQSEPVPVAVVKGDKGEPGLPGRDGKDGLDGAPGKDGERGARGPKGPRGLQGPQGKEGKPGKDGKDGLDGETPDIKPIEDKFQKLYDTFTGQVSSQITRMAYTKNLGGGSSPGSGEVRLLRLDDVDTSTLDDGKYLRYNANTEQLEFVAAFNSTHFRYLTGTILPDQIANNEISISKFVNDSSFASTSYVDSAVANLVDSAPEALDTIWELADALNNNPNFGAEVINSLSLKANTSQISTVGYTGSYNDLTDTPSFANLTSSLVPSANGLYDLGSDTLRWRTLYLAGNTINLGGALLESDGSSISLPSGSKLNGQNIESLINDRIQVANVIQLLPANTSTSSANLDNGIITFTRDDNSQYTLDVSSIQGEVSNSYLTSTYVSNTAFQSYVSNTNPRFSRYLEVANNKTLVAGDNVTLTENATSILIASSGSESANVNLDPYLQVANSTNFVDTLQSQGTGTSLVFSKINNLVTLKTIKAGPNITLSENNGELTIAATGELSVTDSLDFGFVGNDFGLITEADETDSQFDFGTI